MGERRAGEMRCGLKEGGVQLFLEGKDKSENGEASVMGMEEKIHMEWRGQCDGNGRGDRYVMEGQV